MSKTVLITGGTGLVGSAIKEVVSLNLGYNEYKFVFLSSKDGDLKDSVQAEKIFNTYKPTFVIHLAAKVGGLFDNQNNNIDFYNDNVAINRNVFEQCRSHNVKKTISMLSTCIFPDKTSYPINETMLHNGTPHDSNLGYSFAKRMVDIQNKIYSKETSNIYTSIIPTNIYGKNDNFHLEKSHVIPGLIHRMYLAKQNDSKEFKVFGTGKPMRQFVCSMDLAKFCLWVLQNYENCDPVIFSPKEEISIEHVAKVIAKSLNFTGKIVFDTNKSDGQLKKTADNKKLTTLLPDIEFTNFEEGLDNTVNWFLKNYEYIRK